jgi:hypothetical protein
MKCSGPHHISICHKSNELTLESGHSVSHTPVLYLNAAVFESTHAHTTLYAEGNTVVLLSTAQATIINPCQQIKQLVILDGGSHRSYVTERVRESKVKQKENDVYCYLRFA